MKVMYISAEDAVTLVANDDEFVGYKTLSDAVGGMIEAVSLPSGMTLWVNEEGKLNGLPVNRVATELLTREFGQKFDTIVGNAIITGGADDEGETLGLTNDQVATLVANLGTA
jgi:hypothetical protein